MLEPPTNQLINLKKPNNEKLFFLIPSSIFCSQARKLETWIRCADLVATLGYNIKNLNLWSRIAQNYIFLHNLLKNLIVKHSTQLLLGGRHSLYCTTIIVINACPISATIYVVKVVGSRKLNYLRSLSLAFCCH